jgi:hypothetical protein
MASSLEIELSSIGESVVGKQVEFIGKRFQIFGYIESELVGGILRIAYLAKLMGNTPDYIISYLEDGNPEDNNAIVIMTDTARYFFQLQQSKVRTDTSETICDGSPPPTDEYVFGCIISRIEKSRSKELPFYIKSKALWNEGEFNRLLFQAKHLPRET